MKKVEKKRLRPNRIRELRSKGVILSQAMLAKLVGTDETTVSRHESGQRGMSKEQILAYAQVFNVSSYELFFQPEAVEEPQEEATA